MNSRKYTGGNIMSKDDFEFDAIEKSKVTKMLKIAKRRQLVRVTLISVISSILVSFLLLIGITQLNNYSFDNMSKDVAILHNITRPNTEQGTTIINSGIFKSTVVYQNYKVIEGHPVKWDDETYQFKIWNTFRKLNSNNPLVVESDNRVSNEQSSIPNHIYNPQTMEKEMQFYLPFVPYPSYINDLASIKSKDVVAEIAISFDKPYTVSEINKMLPDGVHPVWYWVDTYYNKDYYHNEEDKNFITESANQVYGFRAKKGQIEYGNGTEKDFLLTLQSGLKEKGKYYNEYKRIYDYLRNKKKNPNETDVRIFGVVVTGTNENLIKLENAPYMKAAVLGATVEEK